jgi:hypothetical protein
VETDKQTLEESVEQVIGFLVEEIILSNRERGTTMLRGLLSFAYYLHFSDAARQK